MSQNQCGWRLIVAAGVAIGASTQLARSQNALGDGSALDRSLQQGVRQNSKVRDIRAEMQFQNSIITGNAPGGKSFHGDVGYLAADEFRATLGSNDLFNYYRDSSLSTLPSLGIRGSDAIRYQYSLATGSSPPPALAGSFTMSRSQAATTGGQVGGLRSTADYLTQRESRQTVIAYRPRDDGGATAVTASPLLGVREVTLSATQLGATPPSTSLPSAEPAAPQPIWNFSGMEARPRGVPRPLTRPDAMETSAPTSIDDAAATRADDRVLTRFREEFEKSAAVKAEADKLKPKPEGEGAKGEGATDDQTPSKPADPLDWRARLDELRGQLNPSRKPSKPAKADKPAQENKPKPGGPETPPADAKPTAEPGVAAAEARALEQQRKELNRRFIDSLNLETIRALKATRPIVNDLSNAAPRDNLAYADGMAGGQGALADGNYFDAEERFTRALAAMPGDSMAQVGRIHAQVGSGLYMSAAVNLRSLIADHPELVGTRYGEKLLPSPSRRSAITEQLRSRLGGDDPVISDASGLLLAYIGYQFDDTRSVKDGLDGMAKHVGDDDAAKKLHQLLTEVWADTGNKDQTK